MKRLLCLLFTVAAIMASAQKHTSSSTFDPYVALEFDMNIRVAFMHAAPVDLGDGEKGFVLLFSQEKNVDPFEGSFFFPRHAPWLAVVTDRGEELWRRELTGSIPGTWFLPVLPFDLDGDGIDEIYYVANTGELPLNPETYKLQATDPRTGELTGEWDWTAPTHNQANSYKWRFHLAGGMAGDEPVLVTIQGTYRDMKLQGWSSGMKKRWSIYYPDDFKGSRGSHSTPVLDLNDDGVMQFLHGERCISFDDGKELFVLDGDVWGDHSDAVLPFWDKNNKTWNFFTIREKGDDGRLPRSVTFDRDGRHLWEISDKLGHYHYGWVGDFGPGGERIAMAGRYPYKTEDLPARKCVGGAYDAYTGVPVEIKVPLTGTVVDFNGDGRHEMFNGGTLYDRTGAEIFSTMGKSSMVMAKKILDLPGEQIMVSMPDGRVQVWADRNAREDDAMRARFADPIYKANVRLSASGYNNRLPILNY